MSVDSKDDSSSSTSTSEEQVIEEIRRRLQNPNDTKSRPVPKTNIDLRSPAEVKEYLDNIEIEYKFQCISERMPDGCSRLANFLENIRAKYKDATDLYKKTCDEMQDGRSCLVYSKNKYLGRGCQKDLLESCKYNFIACDLKITDGCLNAGICLAEGIGGLPKKESEAISYFQKACDNKHPVACLRLFNMYLNGIGVARDPQRAFAYASSACDYGDMFGCVNASIMLRKGDGVAQDVARADEYRDKVEEIKRSYASEREHSNVVFGEQHR